MFDKLEDLLIRYEELMSELSEPDVANNPERFLYSQHPVMFLRLLPTHYYSFYFQRLHRNKVVS